MWYEVKWKLDEIEKWRNERRVKKECEAAAQSQNQICIILMREARERERGLTNYTVFSRTQHNSAWHHTHSIYLYLVFIFHLTFDTQPTAITNSTTKANGTTMFKLESLQVLDVFVSHSLSMTGSHRRAMSLRIKLFAFYSLVF